MSANLAIPHTAPTIPRRTLNDFRVRGYAAAAQPAPGGRAASGIIFAAALAAGAFVLLNPSGSLAPSDAVPAGRAGMAPTLSAIQEADRGDTGVSAATAAAPTEPAPVPEAAPQPSRKSPAAGAVAVAAPPSPAPVVTRHAASDHGRMAAAAAKPANRSSRDELAAPALAPALRPPAPMTAAAAPAQAAFVADPATTAKPDEPAATAKTDQPATVKREEPPVLQRQEPAVVPRETPAAEPARAPAAADPAPARDESN